MLITDTNTHTHNDTPAWEKPASLERRFIIFHCLNQHIGDDVAAILSLTELSITNLSYIIANKSMRENTGLLLTVPKISINKEQQQSNTTLILFYY